MQASSYGTGGGGFTFERRVAVRYLAAMLSGVPRPELEDRRVTQVSFQQSAVSSVDDIHVLAAREGEVDPSLELWIAVRRSPNFVKSHAKTRRLVEQLVEACQEPLVPGRERRLVVCAAGGQGSVTQVAELASLARTKIAEESFLAEVSEAGRASKALRDRFGHVEDLVRGAGPSPSTMSVWQLLCQVHFIEVRVEPPDEADWTALLSEVEGWGRDQTPSGALALRSRLVDLADQYDPAGAEVDRARLCRDAYPVLHSSRRLQVAAWEELRRLEQEARDAVPPGCGRSSSLVLPRTEARDELVEALGSEQVLLVSGESGVGKSALVCSVLDCLGNAGTEELESVYLNLRQLPPRASDLRSLLGMPLDRALSEMSAPKRILVIDAADYASGTGASPLAAIVNDALRADVTVCVVSAETEREAVERIVTQATSQSLSRHDVLGLTDDEVDELARAFPALRSMAANSEARGLLRRPAIADLLVRAGGSDVPLSESAAMNVIWSRLVRGGESPNGGAPDTRDQVMRKLARQLFIQDDPDSAYASLDGEALSGLRRDGILRVGSKPWSPLPEFAHDILRDYAVARILGSAGRPAEQLNDLGAPRWALPAARLATEAILLDQDCPSASLEELQRTFDLLVEAGAGARWADVPVEAALGLPNPVSILEESWSWLAGDVGAGLQRVLRILKQRHALIGALPNMRIAHPLGQLLVERGWPDELQEAVEDFMENWLCGLLICAAPGGDRARIGLRELIEYKIAIGDQMVKKMAEEEAIRLASRTPEELAEEEEAYRLQAMVSGISESDLAELSRKRESLPIELCRESTLKFLALLGPDLGEPSEALLRRVADNDPGSLTPVVETPFAGDSLAQYNRSLLVDLVEAYYIDNRGVSGLEFMKFGIRDHGFTGLGVPMAGYWKGPFLAMLRGNFVEGVACLNRILNHAARTQMSLESRIMPGDSDEASDHPGVLMSITGEPRHYAGTRNTWLWYRGTGVGPYPCMSALQALELLCDQILEQESMPPSQLIRTLLVGCENLAMPALAYGLMVRHIEHSGSLIDPYLIEPLVWDLEAARVSAEFSEFAARAARPEPETAVERRKWTVDETVSRLVLTANESRAQELKDAGVAYFERATQDIEGAPEATERLALAQKRAMAFDIDEYEAVQNEDQLLIRLRTDPAVEDALAQSDAEFQRDRAAWQIWNRYAANNDYTHNPDPMDVEEIGEHIAIARDLLAYPPANGPPDSDDAPALVAAAVLETHFLDGICMKANDLVWATRVLTGIMRRHRERFADSPFDPSGALSIYGLGSSRSAARGLPLLLNPDAQPIRDLLDTEGLSERELRQAIDWIFTKAPSEARCAASRALDSVWQSPCTPSGECHHRLALHYVEQSIRHSVLRIRWQPVDREPERRRLRSLWRRRRPLRQTPIHELTQLEGPTLKALASAPTNSFVLPLLNPGLRALGREARNPTCVHSQAADLLDATLEAHRRARKIIDIGAPNNRWDALFAARAVLAWASAGDQNALWKQIEGFADHVDSLHEFLSALAAAAEETPEAAATANEIWPQVIREGIRILSEVDHYNSHRDHRQKPAKIFSALMPAAMPDFLYMYREIVGDGPVTWIDPEAWKPEIELWVNTATQGIDGASAALSRNQDASLPPFPAGGLFGTIDALIRTLSALPITQQAETGIHWVEQLAESAGEAVVETFRLQEWLHKTRPHCTGETEQAWQRIADLMYVYGGWRDQDFSD